MPPVFEGVDDGEHLFVIDFIVAFGFDHRLRSKSNGMPAVVDHLLKQNSTSGVSRGIGFETCWSIGLLDNQYGFL